MALTHINGVLRIFTLDSNEEIAKYTFSKQISTFYYDDSLDKIILFLNDNSGRMIGLKSLKTIEEF